MKFQLLYPLFLLIILTNCKTNQSISKRQIMPKTPDKVILAFGSCSDEDKEQKLWGDILQEQPDIWIWLGDNIYGDTDDMQVLRQKYEKQKSHPLYQQLLASTPVIGTWDDHDYGANDAGKEYPKKQESQQAFLDFLDIPNKDPRRDRAGIYGSYDLLTSIATIKVLLLDTRYFRDPLKKEGNKNIANMEGTVLGEVQWQWLEQELANSKADIHIIASSIQVLPEEHRFEKWANFPKERERLFQLLHQYKTPHPIFISGDRHIGEISKMDWQGTTIYDITSSSLTHGWSNKREEANQHRIGQLVYKENYGIIEISSDNGLQIDAKLKAGFSETNEAIIINK